MSDLVRNPNCWFSHAQAQISLLLQVAFEDVLAEPSGIHSIECVWKLSYFCFNFWKNLCYKLATLFYGICIAAEWGCEFAYIAFWHIWYITPVLKMLEINCSIVKRIWGQCVQCCMDPCCESCGLVFKAFQK